MVQATLMLSNATEELTWIFRFGRRAIPSKSGLSIPNYCTNPHLSSLNQIGHWSLVRHLFNRCGGSFAAEHAQPQLEGFEDGELTHGHKSTVI